MSHDKTELQSRINCADFICGLPDPTISIDHKGIIISCNAATYAKFGYESSELLGKNVSILMPEKLASEHDQHLRNYMNTGVAKVIGTGRKVFVKLKNGRNVPMFLTVSEQKAKEGSYFIGLLRDLTEIDEANSKLDAIVQSAPSIIMFIDSEMRIRFINRTPDRAMKPDLLVGKTVLSLLDGANVNIFEDAFHSAKILKKPTQFLIRHEIAAGEKFFF